MKKRNIFNYCYGIIGALLVFFFGWEFNITAAPWLALPLLIYFFRIQKRWYKTLPIAILIFLNRFFSLHGGWDMSIWLELAFSIVVSVPILVALYADRFFNNKMNPAFSLLLFPCVITVFDYLTTFMNLGMTFSLADTQSSFLALLQISSLLGSFAVGFIVALFAPAAVLFFGNIRNLYKAAKPLIAIAICFAVVMLFGLSRTTFLKPDSQTVRIASIAVEHNEDYWSTVTDKSTPRYNAADKKPEMNEISDELFKLSSKAVD